MTLLAPTLQVFFTDRLIGRRQARVAGAVGRDELLLERRGGTGDGEQRSHGQGGDDRAPPAEPRAKRVAGAPGTQLPPTLRPLPADDTANDDPPR
jgi:hypothetical protein